MKRAFAIAVIGLQFAVLAFMAGEREWVLRTGETMFLRTAPVDPRDPMRGDYVRFGYEIARVPKAKCRGGVVAWFKDEDWRVRQALRDRRVYAEVELDSEGVANVVALRDDEPSGGKFLRGRVDTVEAEHVTVRFGVEAMFMEQGKARALETSPKFAAGVPLNIEVAVSDGGLAVMKGYRWEPLGITLDFEWQNIDDAARTPPARRVMRAITVELKNHSERPVAIVARPNGGAFRLVTDERWSEGRFRWARENEPLPAPAADGVEVLSPGETYRERLDLTTPRWALRDTNDKGSETPIRWEQLENAWGASFRIEYVPPTPAERATLPHAELIRASALRSRAFGPLRGVD